MNGTVKCGEDRVAAPASMDLSFPLNWDWRPIQDLVGERVLSGIEVFGDACERIGKNGPHEVLCRARLILDGVPMKICRRLVRGENAFTSRTQLEPMVYRTKRESRADMIQKLPAPVKVFVQWEDSPNSPAGIRIYMPGPRAIFIAITTEDGFRICFNREAVFPPKAKAPAAVPIQEPAPAMSDEAHVVELAERLARDADDLAAILKEARVNAKQPAPIHFRRITDQQPEPGHLGLVLLADCSEACDAHDSDDLPWPVLGYRESKGGFLVFNYGPQPSVSPTHWAPLPSYTLEK